MFSKVIKRKTNGSDCKSEPANKSPYESPFAKWGYKILERIAFKEK